MTCDIAWDETFVVHTTTTQAWLYLLMRITYQIIYLNYDVYELLEYLNFSAIFSVFTFLIC